MTSAHAKTPLHTLSVGTAGPRIAFLHGLFGQGRNWNQIAKAVSGPEGTDARCLLVDLPDHGRSRWSQEFSFEGYADAVAATLSAIAPGESDETDESDESDDSWTVVGHSLGGKTAMLLALRHPELVEGLVVVDIAPTDYGSLERFVGYIDEMRGLPLDEIESRADAEARFTEPDPGVKAFLLQNLRRHGGSWRWQVNLELIAADAARGADSKMAGWPEEADALPPYEGPVLWIAGGESPYVEKDDDERMRRLFPLTRLLTIKGAGHWVHTDSPEIVIEALRRVLKGAGDPWPTP